MCSSTVSFLPSLTLSRLKELSTVLCLRSPSISVATTCAPSLLTPLRASSVARVLLILAPPFSFPLAPKL